MTPYASCWPIAIRLEVLPGESLIERFAAAERFGFDAVELPGRHLPDYEAELSKVRNRLPLPVSSISLGFHGSLLSRDEAVRNRCQADLRRLLELCAELGAAGVVMPPALRADNADLAAAPQDEDRDASWDAMLLGQLPALANHALSCGVKLLLEPVNRFETDYLTTVGHARLLCERLRHEGLGITADFFHMQLEELKPAVALYKAAPWIQHIHVADNTRVEPGPGSLDLRPGFKALVESGYSGFIVIECRRLSGPANTVLPRSAEYLREIIGEALSSAVSDKAPTQTTD